MVMSMKTNVIILAGYARSGKDTIADYIIEKYKNEDWFYKDKFAQPLYDMLSVMYKGCGDEINYEYINQHKTDLMPYVWNKTWRDGLKELGTEFGRDCFGKDIWVNLALARSLKINRDSRSVDYLIPNKGVVFSDCRFTNEAATFKINPAFNTTLIYVERKESDPQLQHRSEQEILTLKVNADYIVVNNKSFSSLYDQIDSILKDLQI